MTRFKVPNSCSQHETHLYIIPSRYVNAWIRLTNEGIAGAAALDKKAKKQFDATQLAKLGARAEKAPRMPASVGKGKHFCHQVLCVAVCV